MDANITTSRKKLVHGIHKTQSMILTAIPFIIKSHHLATIRTVKRITADGNVKILYFKVSFNGPGFKKEWIETFPTEEAAVEFVARLGFTKYKIRNQCYGSKYVNKDIKNKWYRNQDGIVDWQECYYENEVCIL